VRQAMVEYSILELTKEVARDLTRPPRSGRNLQFEKWLHQVIGPLFVSTTTILRELALKSTAT